MLECCSQPASLSRKWRKGLLKAKKIPFRGLHRPSGIRSPTGSDKRSRAEQEILVQRKHGHVKSATHLIDHVERQRHHAEVVDDQDPLEVEGLAVLHDAGPQRRHKVDVRHDDDGLGERG